MLSPDEFYRQALEGISALRDGAPELVPMLDYYEGVLRAQQEAGSSFEPDLDGFGAELCDQRVEEGRPVLAPDDIEIDAKLFDALFKRICELARQGTEAGDLPGSPLEKLADDGWREAAVKGLLADAVLLDEIADRAGIDRGVFALLTSHALAPFLERYAAGLSEEIDASAWGKGQCPVCGGAPLMAKLEEETGKRRLQCGLCRTEWDFKRVACPFCGTEDQEKLRYFFDEKDDIYRVEVCDECKGYLKTIDARKAEREIVLLVEDLATVHLDLIARREGFVGRFGVLSGPGGGEHEAGERASGG